MNESKGLTRTSAPDRNGQEPRVPAFTEREKATVFAGQRFGALDLSGIDLAGANLARSRFERVNLRGCDLTKADLTEAQFLDCDLRGVRLSGAQLADSSFRGSNLMGSTGLAQEQRVYVLSKGGALQAWHLKADNSRLGEPPRPEEPRGKSRRASRPVAVVEGPRSAS